MTAETMRAAVLHHRLDLRLETRPVPTPRPDELLVAVRSVGVCGSDVHFWQTGRIGDFVVRAPVVLGHECAGEVVAVGAAVTGLRAGDRVALEPGVPCRHCAACRSGRYNLCPEVVFLAAPPVDGAFCEYIAHPADFAYRLPDALTYDEGAMLEPLSVGIHATRRAGITTGASVLVTGAGPIGLCALLTARAAGAARIILSDPVDARLALARDLGATATANPRSERVAEVALRATDGIGVDAVIECSGAAAAVESAFGAVRRGGTIVAVGMGSDALSVPAAALHGRELDVRGVFRYANTYPTALELLASGRANVRPLVTHHFALDEIERAMETAHSGGASSVKVMVHPVGR